MRSTTEDSKAKEKIAAAEILRTPAIVVARRMESRVELILSLGVHATKLQIKAQPAEFGKRSG
jgi:hypothetical protein